MNPQTLEANPAEGGARIASFRSRVLRGQAVYGVFTRVADPLVVEALAATELDFAIVDVENGALTWPQVNDLVGRALARDFPLLLRMAATQLVDVQQALATGAAGLVASHLATAEQVHTVATFTRQGGIARAYAGMARGSNFRTVPWTEFRRDRRERFLFLVQIDDPAGVRNVDPMLASQDVDGVLIGTLTLGLALESAPQEGSTDVAIQQVLAACAGAGRRSAVHVLDGSDHDRAVSAGATIFVIGNELNILRAATQSLLARIRTA